MPRNPSGIYTKPFPDVVSGTTIESAVHNGTVNDVELDLNTARPIVAGGTGSTTAQGARANLQAERATAQVTNYDSHVFEAGSFYSLAGATAAPNGSDVFMGTAVVGTDPAQAVLLEARPVSVSNRIYYRRRFAGTWQPWEDAGAPGDFVKKTGDTMTGALGITCASANIALTNTNPADGHIARVFFAENATPQALIDTFSSGSAGGNAHMLRIHNYQVAPIVFNTAGTERMRITGAGNVGIGTTNPTKKLQVDDAANPVVRLNCPSATGASQLMFAENGTDRALVDYLNSAFPGQSDRMRIGPLNATAPLVFLTNAAEQMRITAAGNVGIGTTSPQAPLEVRGGDGYPGQLRVTSTSNDARIDLLNANGTTATGYGSILMSRFGGFEGMRFMINNTDRMIIDENGNVGIGTTSPAERLHVFGNARADKFIPSSAEGIDMATGVSPSAGSGSPYFQNCVKGGPAGFSLIHIQAMHYSGVWAGWQMDATGSAVFQFRNNGEAHKQVAGDWAAVSDARIKNVVGNYELGLAAILQLQPRRFTFKGNNTYGAPKNHSDTADEETVAKAPKTAPKVPYKNSTHYDLAVEGKEFVGLLAQEAEVALPGMVTRSKGYIDGVEVYDMRDLNPTELTYALINAIKELNAKIETLQ